jgi:hypothetical protein
VQYRIEDGIEKKGKRADHDHDFKGHDEKNDDAAAGHHLTEKLQPIMSFHNSPFYVNSKMALIEDRLDKALSHRAAGSSVVAKARAK